MTVPCCSLPGQVKIVVKISQKVSPRVRKSSSVLGITTPWPGGQGPGAEAQGSPCGCCPEGNDVHKG